MIDPVEVSDTDSDDELLIVADLSEKIKIMGIVSATPYYACPKKPCNNKKLITVYENAKYVMKCPTCLKETRTTDCKVYCVVRVLAEKDEKISEMIIFQAQLRQIMGLRGIEFDPVMDIPKLEMSLAPLLGMKLKVKLHTNKIMAACLDQ